MKSATRGAVPLVSAKAEASATRGAAPSVSDSAKAASSATIGATPPLVSASDWQREFIARSINGDSIIQFHNYEYFKRNYMYQNNFPKVPDQVLFEVFIALIEYYKSARSNFILPSLYYKCFSIKNLRLTSYEHMHILVPLQFKIYCVFTKIQKLIDGRYLNLKDNNFLNDSIKKEFKLLYDEYFQLNRYLVNIFFLKIKTRRKYLTLEDYKVIISNLDVPRNFPSKIIKIEYELACYKY